MSEGVRPVLVCLADVPRRNVLAFVRDRRARELFGRADSLVLARAQARQAARTATSPARSIPPEDDRPGSTG